MSASRSASTAAVLLRARWRRRICCLRGLRATALGSMMRGKKIDGARAPRCADENEDAQGKAATAAQDGLLRARARDEVVDEDPAGTDDEDGRRPARRNRRAQFARRQHVGQFVQFAEAPKPRARLPTWTARPGCDFRLARRAARDQIARPRPRARRSYPLASRRTCAACRSRLTSCRVPSCAPSLPRARGVLAGDVAPGLDARDDTTTHRPPRRPAAPGHPAAVAALRTRARATALGTI